MNLNTAQLKEKIEDEIGLVEQQKVDLRKEIKRLEDEKSQLQDTFKLVERVEGLAEGLVLSGLEQHDEPRLAM